MKHIHVVAVAFEKFNHLKVFVQSWLNQTHKNWTLTVIHDGPNNQFDQIMTGYQKEDPDRIDFFSTEQRYNDYGHTLRDMGIRQSTSDYILLTNADNYFVPRAIELINVGLQILENEDPEVLMFNMIHSHQYPGNRNLPPYSFFDVDYKRNSIDISAAIVKTELSQRVGFRDKSFAGDATYFEDIEQAKYPEKLKIHKLPMVLFVHN
jgi:glycosyltransferase involved in cell wall biosynthesis